MTALLRTNELARAAGFLRDGGLVAFPTETVYGLGADARDPQAVAAIYAAKGRPSFNPLIVHVASLAQAETLADFDPIAHQVARAFWPGPLTLVLPLRKDAGLAPGVTAGLETVGLRVPALPLARDLIEAAGCPLAAPSANPSGQISPTTAAHVMEGLDGKIAAVFDGGACTVGLESTILGGDPLTLLRPGGVSVEQIEALLGQPLATREQHDDISAPGQMASHYAPETRLRINAETARDGELLIGFGAQEAPLNLSKAADLAEAAAQLFATLRAADAQALREGLTLAVAPIPNDGLGAAINDRLIRAAAPKSL